MGFWIPNFELGEINGSRQEQYTNDGASASVQLIGNWDDRYSIEHGLRGISYPWNNKLRCNSVQIQPYIQEEFTEGTTQEVYNYTKCLFNVQFSDDDGKEENEGDDGEGNTVSFTESIEPNFQMQEMDYHVFKWSDNSQLKEKEAPSKLVPSLTITRNYSGLPSLPSWFYSLLGSCNKNSWTDNFLGKTFEAESLMFAASSASKTVSITETVDDEGQTIETEDEKWQITFKLIYRQDGWNKFQKPGSTTPQEIKYTNSNETFKIYPPKQWSFS